MKIRSLLYTPGDDTKKLAKVGGFGADGVVLDLEDAVSASRKTAAREQVRMYIPILSQVVNQVYVRINPIEAKTHHGVGCGLADIEAVVCSGLDGIVVPKAESAEQIKQIDSIVSRLERQRRLSRGQVTITPLLESALGLWNAFEIASATRRTNLVHFGAADFIRDVGMDWSRDETELLYARSRLAIISKVAKLDPPIDSPWLRLDDQEGLKRSITGSRALGFQGKLCIHPKQVSIVNWGFTDVSSDKLAYAKKIVEEFSTAERKGIAALVVDGQFVDYPVVENARTLLELDKTQGGF